MKKKIEILLSEPQKEDVRAKAKLEGVTMGRYVKSAVMFAERNYEQFKKFLTQLR